MTGGGSGGHITPILAVAAELKKLDPDTRIVYIGQAGESLLDIPSHDPNIDEVFTVRAGKFRRYHGEGWRQLFDFPTQYKNLRDTLFVLIGSWQSFRLLRRIKPEVIFTRGGFVSVPVAVGAIMNRVPYITHDSDSVPSLANRLIARWARLHAVALPKEVYPYPQAKTLTVGIPLEHKYQPVTPALQKQYRQELELPLDAQVVLITGGGNGAAALNDVVLANASSLLKSYPALHLVHVAGRTLEDGVAKAYDGLLAAPERKRVTVLGFVTEFYRYSGAADVIVARAGATSLAGFAAQGKACVIIPAGQLVGDHQTKNAQVLANDGAIIMLTQEQAEQERRLAHVVAELLDNAVERRHLSEQLSHFAHPDAAKRLAMVLLEQVKTPSKNQK